MTFGGSDRYGNALSPLGVHFGFDEKPDPKCELCHGTGTIASAGCTSAIYHKCYCVKSPKSESAP